MSYEYNVEEIIRLIPHPRAVEKLVVTARDMQRDLKVVQEELEECALALEQSRETARQLHAGVLLVQAERDELLAECDKLITFYGAGHPAKPWPPFRAAIAKAKGGQR